MREPHLSRFIMLASFSDTLLVVSILQFSLIANFSRFCSPEGVINSSCGHYGFFLTWGEPFQDCGGAYLLFIISLSNDGMLIIMLV